MLYSKLFGKPSKNSTKHESINADLLIRAGFIDQTMAGVYSFLPLGIRVLAKIEQIIREEMNEIGQEMLMPSLAPKSIWEQTGRLDTIDVLMQTAPANELAASKHNANYILNCTHEDVITPIAKRFNFSYKDLPFAAYQIQTKFRNEPRAKSGLMRCREFRMKDMYSFHESIDSLMEFYETSKTAYWNVFERLGLKNDTFIALASGGDFTENFSHEFQTKIPSGEDIVLYSPKTDIAYNREVSPSRAPKGVAEDDQELLPMEERETPGIVGVDQLVEFLKVDITRTIKTLIYENDDEVIVAAVRGDYDINEEKLRKATGVKQLALASEETVRKITGAEIGYAGVVGLPEDVRLFIDDSIENMKNFETGGNKTNYHNVNVNFERDLPRPEKFYDLKLTKEGDIDPETGEKFEMHVVSEVGNIFPLETKFSKAIGYQYTDESGEQKDVYMGSYGIGPSRVMGVIVEKFHDENGIVWPENIAPYQVHIVGLNLDDENVAARANSLYKQLQAEGIEVLFDDRVETRAGEKFADADLIGIPWRLVISKRSTGDVFEVKRRDSSEGVEMSLERLIKEIK